MNQDSNAIINIQIRRALPVLLAGMLQLMPMLRATVPLWIQGAAPSAWAIVLRLAAGAVVALESVHAVSGNSGVNINSAPSDTGFIGQPYFYEITTSPYIGQAFNTSPNPPAPGLLTDKTGIDPGSGFTPGAIFGTPTIPGSYRILLYAYRYSNASGGTASAIFTLTIQGDGSPVPTITAPLTNQTVAPGGTAEFSVEASGAQYYAWTFRGQFIANATNSTFQVANAQAGSAGAYAVIVSNTGGAVTNSATLTVASTPVITSQPQSQIALAGSDVNFSVSTSGTGLNFQWLFNGTNLTAATSYTLNLAGVTTNQSGLYSVVISNSTASVTSGNAQLLVVAPPSGAIAPSVSLSPPHAGLVTVSFATLPGYRYLLQSSASLSAANWITLTNLPPAFSASNPVLEQPVNTGPSSFYRVELLPD